MEIVMIPNLKEKSCKFFFFNIILCLATVSCSFILLRVIHALRKMHVQGIFCTFHLLVPLGVENVDAEKVLRWLLFYSCVMILLNDQNIRRSWLLQLETRKFKTFFFSPPLDFQLNSHLSTLANIHKIYHTLNRLVMTCHFLSAEQLGLQSSMFHD